MLLVLVSNNEALTAPASHQGETTKSVLLSFGGKQEKGRKIEEKEKGMDTKRNSQRKGKRKGR